MKVILDTNVLISALLWKGKLASLYHLINEQKITLCFTKETFNELIKVFKYPHILKKVEKEKIDLAEIVNKLVSKSIVVSTKIRVKIIKEDPFDNYFLACARATQASFIVSGDKHLLNLKKFKNIPILSPQEFLKRTKNALF